MIHSKKTGFTLVEIVVVLTVLAVLITLSILGINRYVSESRDAQRVADVSVIGEKLEKYYEKNGEYPLCSSLQGNTLTIKNGPLGIERDALVVPTSTADTSSVICNALGSDEDAYAYIGTDCDAGGCPQWQLQYYEESNDSIVHLDSRHNSNVVPDPYEVTLSNTTFTANQIQTICSNTANAPSGYTVVTPASGGGYSGTSADEIIYRATASGSTLGNGGNDILCIGTSTANIGGGAGDDIVYVQSTTGSITGDDGFDSIISLSVGGGVSGGNNDDVFYVQSTGGSLSGDGGYDKAHISGGTYGGSVSSIEEYF